MPFSNKRNSRDDNSRKSRGNSDSFKSRSDKNNNFGKKSSYGSKDQSDRGPFRKDDNRENRSFGSKKFGDKPSFRDENNSFRSKDHSDKPFNKGTRSFDKNDSSKPFARKDSTNRFDKSERSFDRKNSFKRADRNESTRSFDRKDNSFEKRDSYKRFDKDERSSNGRKKSFDGPYKPSNRKFDGDRARNFDENKNFDEKQYIKRPKKKAETSTEDDGLIRLNRYIANAGICSRRKADELIAAGVIWVNGEAVTELGTKVDPATDEIRYNNERLKREKMVYVLLNKPKDYITTTDDPQERHTVMELVSKATKERIYPVGRLDRNTTGLLLMTNDGNLAEKLSHPRNSISKIYNVELNKSLTQGDFNKISFGIELEDGVIKPDDLSYVQGGSKREIGIQIHSGKNRIVRRIFESLGYEVVKLDRVVYANLTKKDLPRGRWRYLEEREIIQLKHLIK
ncbi:rRNA pseudouridine synthase [Sphingobacterium sp. N143]|uniref:pseudouridine synthase n=1 Tax=Sphingobacterium sp. N143 TaxID=2746727 RepID=UPI002578DAFA|nr:pseudouridine synthase [Sphingobacterium sp. N143]MDM1294810.1 rRNA pseudouridine synthase [Sphingobacterium sp. N143]